VEAVKMLAHIAAEAEPSIQAVNYPPNRSDDTNAISAALHAIDDAIDLQCIVAFTSPAPNT
jgi:pyruvate kinase